ncbi:MAG: hypothetical protein CBC48_03935 [bacterium TMED88]|nr:hypothetical protein [Deltaproteobacteria bacterium]OUV35502.1 MAG: hypothetical protein CBC48_03935 [bacterium TMED88]
MNTTLLKKCRYWPFYCEENVWSLCQAACGQPVDARAVVVTGQDGPVAFLRQRALPAEECILTWDYHVFLLFREPHRSWKVFDPDTILPQPCSADVYALGSFPDLDPTASGYRPRFRCVEASLYVKTFCSDRRHMRDASGQYFQTPPPWPTVGHGHNLDRLIDMSDPFVGEILDDKEFRLQFGENTP